ncbi:hypothetical protein [Desulfocurvus sp. DL9XJH121]
MSRSAPAPRRLLDLHPLFRRLSGEVIWLMFEEHDADPEAIQAFMDRLGGVLGRTTELIEAALSGEDVYARVTVREGRTPCETCARLAGRIIPLGREGAESLLPPYALGCPLGAEIVAPGADTPPPGPELLPGDAPHGRLVCGDWIFSHPWHEDAE